jgi:hypothetical protein
MCRLLEVFALTTLHLSNYRATLLVALFRKLRLLPISELEK